MTSKNDIDFNDCYDKANNVLVGTSVIASFPYSIKKVIMEYSNINCIDEQKLKSLLLKYEGNYDKSMSIIKIFGSNDAVLFTLGNMNLIIYSNDGSIDKRRIKWSLCHEFGHYILGHDKSDIKNYEKYEVETNFFTAQLLMPEQIINELRRRGKIITIDTLVKWFGVSKLAARKRIETLRKADSRRRSEDQKMVDGIIVNKYREFIDSVAPLPSRSLDYFEEDEQMEMKRNTWRSSRKY